MARSDHHRPVSPYADEASGVADTGVDEVLEDEAASTELQLLRAKVAELRVSEHRLRVQNLALRARLQQLKSGRSFERKLYVALALLPWPLFMFAAGLVSFISANH